MSGRSKSKLLTANPKKAIATLQHAVVSAVELQQAGQDYKDAVASPGGSQWEGVAAEAAQGVSGDDERSIYGVGEWICSEAPKALDSVVLAVENRTTATNLIDEATGHDYTVAEDLTVTWNSPDGASQQAIADGKRFAAKYQKMIRDAYDGWWNAELAAQKQIDALSDSLDTIFAPLGGLDARDGMEDGSAIQGGYVDPALLRNLHTAATLTPEQDAALAAGNTVTIPANQMQYLYQFAQAFEGKSTEDIAAYKATLPASAQDDMARALALVNNRQVITGVDSHQGVSETTKGSFLPAAGSLANLPSSMRDALSRTDRVTVGPMVNAPGAIQPPTTNLQGVGELQDVANIFQGAGSTLNGTDAGRAMLDAASQYANADIEHRANMHSRLGDVLNSDHHGYDGTAVGETGVNRALADVLSVAGQDHTDMHNLLHDNPTDGEKFLRAVTQEPYGDKSAQVGDQFRWMDDDRTSKIHAETADRVAHYLAEHGDELKGLPGIGDQSFGQANPGVAQGMAEGVAPYERQLAGGHGPDNGVVPFDNSGRGSAIGMSDMFATFDQDHDAAAIVNGAGRDAFNHMLAESAQGGAEGPNDFTAAGHLSNAMSLGAQDADLFSRETAQWQQAQHDQNTGEVIENWKRLVSLIPGGEESLNVGEVLNSLGPTSPGQNPAQIQGDQIMKMLIGDGTALSSRDYHAAILEGLAQTNPNIAHDPQLAKYFTNGHVDASRIVDRYNNAAADLDRWFTNSSKDYGFDPNVLNAWQNQEVMGSLEDPWPR